MTWRRLGVLLRHLPRESAYIQATVGERAQWSDVEHLLATLIDVVQVGNYLTTRAHFKGTPQPPKAIGRPGDVTTRPRSTSGRVDVLKLLTEWRSGGLAMTETNTREVT